MTEFRKYIPLFLFGDENMIDIDKMVDGYYSGSQFYPGGGYKTSDWIDVSHFDFPSVFNLKWTNSSTTANLKVIRFGANKNYLGDWTTIYPYSDPDGDNRSAFVTEPAAEQYITNTTFNNSTTIYSAVAGGLKSITAKGICTQASTPTPDAPVDIVCNNGAISCHHASGLPTGYTLFDVVSNRSNTNIMTGIVDDVDDFKIEIRVQPSLQSWYIVQSRASSNGPIFGISGSLAGNKISFGAGLSGVSATSDIVRDTSHIYTVIGEHKNGTMTLYVKDETDNIEDTQVEHYNTSDFVPATSQIGIWGNGFNIVTINNYIYYVRIYKSGVKVADYMPCQHNEENGFYDFVSETFKGASAGIITAGTEISDPVEIYYDGTPEVLTVSASGAETQTASVENLLSVGNDIDEQEIVSGKVTKKVGVKVFDGTENWSMSSSVSGVFLFYPTDMKPCNPPQSGLSTHFKGTSVATASMPDLSVKNTYGSGGVAVICIRFNAIQTVGDFKTFLADQYANGTPVIVIYPLLDETTDSVAGQELALADGTNYVSATGSTTPLSFDANYTIKGEDVAYIRVTMVNDTTDLGMYKTYEYSHSTSIINPDTLRQGLYSSTGEFDATNAIWLTTDFIPVENGEYEIEWVRYGYGNLPVRVVAFDENKQFKSYTEVGENPDSSATYTISDNTVKYIAISYPKNMSRVYRAYKK